MAERSYEEETVIVRRGPGWGRIAALGALAFILILLVAIAVLWTQRRRQPLLTPPTFGLRFDVLHPEDRP